MLTGHLGFAVGTHYCGGFAVETQMMLGHRHLDCGMEDMDNECERNSNTETHFEKIPCCENDYLSLEVENEFKPSVEQSNLNVEFVAAFVISYMASLSTDQGNPQYTIYEPPLVTRDISVLHQVFII